MEIRLVAVLSCLGKSQIRMFFSQGTCSPHPAEDGTETHILCVTCEVSPEHFMLLLAIIFVMGWGLRYSKVKWPVVKLF